MYQLDSVLLSSEEMFAYLQFPWMAGVQSHKFRFPLLYKVTIFRNLVETSFT